MDIFVKNCKPTLTVLGVDSCKEEITKALVSTAKREHIKGMKDLFLYKYQGPVRCSLIIENQVSMRELLVVGLHVLWYVDTGYPNNTVSYREPKYKDHSDVVSRIHN